MVDKVELRARLEFRRDALKELRKAYLALIKGGVKEYAIADHRLTRFDLPKLQEEIEAAEKKVDELTALLGGQKPRRAVAVIPRDW